MELRVLNKEGKVVERLTLEESELEVNHHLLFMSVKSFLDNQRLGTAKTKSRGEVRGGGRKPWRQKGTGRARHGTIRSPIWKGGGVVFGPTPRSFYHALNKKEKRVSVRQALANKIQAGKLVLVDSLDLELAKTKEAKSLLNTLGVGGKALVVPTQTKEMVKRAFTNLPRVKVLPADSLNAYWALWADWVILEKEGFLWLWGVESDA
ncbi:MAG: large subunit ribosomal protein [Candidatus Atribacteria bacterium]|nr:large subunit ribosomal protein [Candidatus Atribacteria bacterium]